jgi:hypothetical protein
MTNDVAILLHDITALANDYVAHTDINVCKLAAIVLAVFDSPEDGPEVLEVIRAILDHDRGDA